MGIRIAEDVEKHRSEQVQDLLEQIVIIAFELGIMKSVCDLAVNMRPALWK